MKRQIVLASSSPTRRQILERITLSCICHSPNIDETALANESAADLVVRLSREKAKAVAQRYPDALIIGADQVAENNGEIVSKPSSYEDAVQQLQRASGSLVTLHSGVALYDASADDYQSTVQRFEVEMRELDDGLIERYLKTEQPYDCCGSIKSEGLGIALLKRVTGDDPNTLLGLPVIQLIDMLKNKGIELI